LVMRPAGAQERVSRRLMHHGPSLEPCAASRRAGVLPAREGGPSAAGADRYWSARPGSGPKAIIARLLSHGPHSECPVGPAWRSPWPWVEGRGVLRALACLSAACDLPLRPPTASVQLLGGQARPYPFDVSPYVVAAVVLRGPRGLFATGHGVRPDPRALRIGLSRESHADSAALCAAHAAIAAESGLRSGAVADLHALAGDVYAQKIDPA